VIAQWYIARDGQKAGPYTEEELQKMSSRGDLHGDELVWREGMATWQAAHLVLGQFFSASAHPAPRSAAAPARAAEVELLDEDDRMPSLRREPRPQPQFPGRLISPGFFLLLVITFLLPWVDVRCNGFTIVSQSGLQACFGGYSEGAMLNDPGMRNGPRVQRDRSQIKAAPLMIVYGVAILAGLIAALALPVGLVRMGIVGTCAVAGFLLAIGQLIVGFPIAAEVAKANAEQMRNNPIINGNPIPLDPFNPAGAPLGINKGGPPMIMTVETSPWYWLNLFLLAGPIGGLFLEHLVVFAGRRRRRSEEFA
jgi:hypothetical protein